jgi:hypothetical protein
MKPEGRRRRTTAMNWTVRPVAVGTAADTPSSLRAKAAEFLRLAAEHGNPTMIEELHQLAAPDQRFRIVP